MKKDHCDRCGKKVTDVKGPKYYDRKEKVLRCDPCYGKYLADLEKRAKR